VARQPSRSTAYCTSIRSGGQSECPVFTVCTLTKCTAEFNGTSTGTTLALRFYQISPTPCGANSPFTLRGGAFSRPVNGRAQRQSFRKLSTTCGSAAHAHAFAPPEARQNTPGRPPGLPDLHGRLPITNWINRWDSLRTHILSSGFGFGIGVACAEQSLRCHPDWLAPNCFGPSKSGGPLLTNVKWALWETS